MPGETCTLRLVLVIASLAGGGAERVISTLAGAWAERGFQVTLVTFYGADRDFYSLHPAVRRVELAAEVDAPGAWGAVRSNAGRIAELRRVIRAADAEAVVSFGCSVNVVSILAARAAGVVPIVSERTDPSSHPVGRMWEALRAVLYRHAAALVVLSPEAKRWSRRWIAERRIHVVPNPLRPGAALPRAPGPSRRIVAMGRLSAEKGFDLLLEAFARVAPRAPGWTLTILGEGSERDRLAALVRSLGIEHAVEMPGTVADPTSHLRAAGLFVLPSRYEGFPNALVEAMACGLPVVAADCPSGPRQIVRHGVDGVLVPPDDVASLAEGMERLIGDDAERERLAARAVEVADRFSTTRVLQMWDQVFAAVVPGR